MPLSELEFGTREFSFIHWLRAENSSATLNVLKTEVGSPFANRLWLNRGTLNCRDFIERDGFPFVLQPSSFGLHFSIPSSSFMPC